MITHQETCIKEDLEKIYADVSEWLKFAEAKHAAALALWAALIAAVLSLDTLYDANHILYYIILILLIIGMFVDILAFIPFINKNKKFGDICYELIKKTNPITDNLIFYILGNFSCGEILDQNNPPKAGMQIGRSL